MSQMLDSLNPQQREAVLSTEGPLLILAGAGSGKTRVLTCRTAYLIEEKQVPPYQIMAITFTNKAAGEMRERVDRMIGLGSENIWVSTFHSTCCRMLRRFIDRLGYDRSFTIYDTDDSKQVIKEVMRALEIDPKVIRERGILSKISAAKNNLLTPDDLFQDAERWEERRIAEAYRLYQERLAANNALDFDDLLVKTVELFEKAPEVLEYYQDRFRYIMIDEYQDTNTVQFRFVSLLAAKYRNLCVVGDDDQSIYKFRGADIQNILGFEKVFRDAKVIRLEQNYRSTQSILDAANAVIANNKGRKEKKLWTDNGVGDKIRFRQFASGYEEAEFVAGEISRLAMTDRKPYTDFAILYRTNAQSRLFEEKFITANIPYKIVGGVNFYARKEIKDLLAYLKTIDNGMDDLAVKRIINVPKRGIGATTITKIEQYAAEQQISFFDALEQCETVPGVERAKTKLRSFVNFINRFRGMNEDYLSVVELLNQIIEETGYVKALEAEDTDEAKARIENIEELMGKTRDYVENTEAPTLSDFLQQVSLVADIDTVDENAECVLLMTLHSAKGLEFDTVYMTGMEDGLFPGFMAISEGGNDPTEMEEERRLCYVGITRAQKHLTLTAARMRMVRGEMQPMKASRFVREIPREMVELDRETTDTRNFMKPAQTSFGDVLGFGRSTDEFSSGFGSRGGFGGDAGADGYGSRYSSDSGAGRYGSGSGGYGSGVGSYGSGSGSGRSYGSAQTSSQAKFKMRDFKVTKASSLDYGVGDLISHVKFGLGTVLDIKDGSKDYEVTVDFEKYGQKRMFASFAKLKKVQQ